MFKIFSLMVMVLISCTTAMDSPQYNGKFETVYYSESDSVQKVIKIEFIDESKCKIAIITDNELYDVTIYRYMRKGGWVMIKNMSTGKWSKLEYLSVDQNTFKLKLIEVDSLRKWRVFHRQKEAS